ncbi:hypothetical protein PA598K_03967 [Paenibacillus sp. 598K]|uniref:hypothetical protein n=1 Tax=Paenibacillus sp. 598K TaxID=1117987 RepID=UPI000FF96505|nr:hypothetical protein [Paenibacillus sp. 598K]GBF75550.1 hypothetical protein PA598K_03967 [Paenibacillus sp. 598K]
MMNRKKIGVLMVVYLLAVGILGRTLFDIPNGKYLGILNIADFYATSCLAVLACALFIYFFSKGSPIKKIMYLFVASIIIFAGFVVYFYTSLPAYTYEEAATKVEAFERGSGKSVQVQIPEHREDKLGVGSPTYLKITHYTYYIYLNVDGEPVTYRFNPLDGEFEHAERRLMD